MGKMFDSMSIRVLPRIFLEFIHLSVIKKNLLRIKSLELG